MSPCFVPKYVGVPSAFIPSAWVWALYDINYHTFAQPSMRLLATVSFKTFSNASHVANAHEKTLKYDARNTSLSRLRAVYGPPERDMSVDAFVMHDVKHQCIWTTCREVEFLICGAESTPDWVKVVEVVCNLYVAGPWLLAYLGHKTSWILIRCRLILVKAGQGCLVPVVLLFVQACGISQESNSLIAQCGDDRGGTMCCARPLSDSLVCVEVKDLWILAIGVKHEAVNP